MDGSGGVGSRLAARDDTEGNQVGSVSLITGPMWAGKTTELQRRVRRYDVAKKRVVAVSHTEDTRYTEQAEAVTHDGHSMVARKASHLLKVTFEDGNEPHVIAVDEGQMFPDLAVACNRWADKGIIVIVAALDTTYQRKPFESVAALTPDFITKLTAVCSDCYNEATFTHRTSDEDEVLVAGGADKYEALCRACFNKKVKK